MANLHVGDVTNPHRRAFIGDKHDVLDLFDAGHAAQAMHKPRFAPRDDLPATDVVVVLLQRLKDIPERQAILEKSVGGHDDMKLLLFAAPRVHLRNTRHLAQLRLDDPIVKRAKLFQCAMRIAGANDVMEYLS